MCSFSLFLFQVESPVLLRFCRQHWESMAGKNTRKAHHLPTDAQESSSEVVLDERSMLELFISNQNKRDEEMCERALLAEKKQLEAEERAEARRLKAAVAAEEREEKRREKAKIAEEEREEKRRERMMIAEEQRMEVRALEKERRKKEEAMRQEAVLKEREEWAAARQEEAQRVREEEAKRAAEKAAALQEEAAKIAYDQQKEAMEFQAELGRKAAEAQRLESQRVRTKDRAVASISAWQKVDDLEEFLLSSERKLRAGDVPEGEWLGIMASKLNGEVGATWQENCLTSDNYQEVRAAVLMGCGYTQKAAGEAFYAFRFENLKGLSADQVYRKGVQLLRRMVAPKVLDKETEFYMVRPWVYSCIGRRARSVLEARVIESGEDLVRGLQDHLAEHGDRLSGKVTVFSSEDAGSQRPTYGVGSETEFKKEGALGSGSGALRCLVCGKMGHKAVDCWHKEKGAPGAKAAESNMKIVCYICGVEGHKATTCPGKREVQKGANVKQVNHIKVEGVEDVIVQGRVNGRRANLMLDSGAHMTIVPEEMVDRRLRTNEVVVLRGFQGETTITAPTAKVKLEVNGIGNWEETVALVPAEEGRRTEVIYGLRLTSQRGLNLVALANGLDDVEAELKREKGPIGPKVEPKRVLKIARVTMVVPKAKEQKKGNEKKIVKIVKKEREGTSSTASGKTVRNLAPNSRSVAVSRKQSRGAAVRQKNVLKPVKAFDVVLRASVVEQARQKRAKARLESSRRKRKMKWQRDCSQSETSNRLSQNVEGKRNFKLDGLGVRAEEEMMKNFGFVLDGLGERAEDDRVKKKDEFVVGSKTVNENKGEKKCDFVSTGFSSMSSKPTPSVVCCAADGLGTFTRRRVSYRDVLLSTVPSQNQDSRFGDPKREEGGDLRKRIGDSRQLDAGRRERKRTSSGAEATENDFEERIEEDEPGLRAAPFLFVGGDVGSESPQKEGVATDGVALQN